ATRAAGKKVMQSLVPYTPTMIGGSADLVESTYTEFVGGGTFSATHAGRNIAFGIREHGMGSIVNGIALHGGMVKPYGATFMQFSDYMRPAVRLSALGHVEDIWVWTHDSVALGEDGPTHQPVEHYAALRAIPNLWFVRPADANETSYAWKVALEREGKARRPIEAVAAPGWKDSVGDHGDTLALGRFGASAPGDEVLERLGCNLDNVIARASALLERVA